MNIYQFYGKIAPWSAPAPAAIALAGRLYGEWATSNHLTAWAIAIFSLLALETVGGTCSYQMIRTSRQKRWGWFGITLMGVLAYVVLGVWALWGVTAWIYIVMAVFAHIAVAAEIDTQEERADTRYERDTALKMEKEHTAQVRATARATIAEVSGPRPVVSEVSDIGLDMRPVRTDTGQKVSDYMTEHPDASVRAAARDLGMPRSTVGEHIKKWRGRW